MSKGAAIGVLLVLVATVLYLSILVATFAAEDRRERTAARRKYGP